MRLLLAAVLGLASTVATAAPRPAEVAVLSTLHRLHAQVPAYTQEVLAESIRRLDADVLCIEVNPDKYAQRAPESTKVEYPETIYPLIDAGHYKVYPMEPENPLYDQIGGAYMASFQAFASGQPEASAAFSAYGQAIYAALRHYWTSPARVNDAVTDQQLRAKHALQEGLVGEGERAGWQAWNRHFLEVVVRAAAENPGKRIVVLVGAEHGYWLREHLAAQPNLRLLDTAALLAD
ncbi:hypothetical protein [Pseudoxanthomonas sp. SGT-18]|uniref:hypothetical protein n=1 Tax=Pseudoxanthomonas sp. SGT-18 TaxID=2493087 RepID=UPI000F62AF8E|nr:hypothetical protein [Pseudoxanthomonas sp. SGT-18]